MNTESIHLSLEELIAGADGPAAERHLAACPSCDSEMRQWRQMSQAVSCIVSEADPPPGLVEMVFNRVDRPRAPCREGSRLPASWSRRGVSTTPTPSRQPGASLDRTDGGSEAIRGVRLGMAALAGSVAVVLVVALVMVTLASRPTPNKTRVVTRPHATRGVGRGATVNWQLVSDTTGPWHSVPAPANLAGLPRYKLICPSDTTCYLLAWGYGSMTVDQVDATNDGGNTWRTVALPTQVGPGASLSCSSANTCAVLGLDPTGHVTFLETTDGGQKWSIAAGPAPYGANSFVDSLSCVSAFRCTAVVSESSEGGSVVNSANGAFVVTRSDGGATWSEAAVPTSFVPAFSGLQCVAPATCVIVGSTTDSSAASSGDALYSTDGGVTWQQASVPSGSAPLQSVTCADATDCLAAASVGPGWGTDGGSAVVRSSDGGRTWTNVAGTGLPGGLESSVSCPSIAECWASGVTIPQNAGSAVPISELQGVVAVSTDEGQTWQPARLPVGVHVVMSVSCPSTNACYAFAILQSSTGQPVFGLLTNRSD